MKTANQPDVTHCLAREIASNQKIYGALAAGTPSAPNHSAGADVSTGQWLLRQEYVEGCERAERWLPEDHYQWFPEHIRGGQHVDLCQRLCVSSIVYVCFAQNISHAAAADGETRSRSSGPTMAKQGHSLG